MRTPLQMSSGMCQKHTRLWRQTMADISGCFTLPYCHTESLSPWLSNDTWAAVYFCLHLYAQDPTLHIKSSCLQEGKMFILTNAPHSRCLGKSCLWGAERGQPAHRNYQKAAKMQASLIRLNIADQNLSSEPAMQTGKG